MGGLSPSAGSSQLTLVVPRDRSRGEARKKAEVIEVVGHLLSGLPPEVALRAVYAMVGLGATVCRPGDPHCRSCPLLDICQFNS